MTLAEEVLGGSRRALARAITAVENQAASAPEVLAALFSHTGHAHLLGVTGAPGTGKSSLVNQLALDARKAGKTVAVLAVDPTSPFTGGAILGDRIRMRELAGDSGVFIRSMATRGSLGGLARATADVVKVLDAAGFDYIMIETVGAGQSEVDIARHAQTTIVVEAPGMGDDVQAIKAGILEIADILVVNKADDPRAETTVRALRAMLDLAHPGDAHAVSHHGMLMRVVLNGQDGAPTEANAWRVPVMTTNALSGEGVPEVLTQVVNHRQHLRDTGEMARREMARIINEVDAALRDRLMADLLDRIPNSELETMVARIARRELAPQQAVSVLVAAYSPIT